MTFDEYQAMASKTAQFNKDEPEYKLMYLSMGLAGESGEAIEKLKKVMRNDGGVLRDETRASIAAELGDVLWYLSQLARELGVSLEAVAQANLAKLASRVERGVIKSEGDTR
jgi:NTP pyrophosphatase (non-canonical NTP hydrolase)